MLKRIASFALSLLMMMSVVAFSTVSTSAAAARGPIKNNGTNGIYIDILGYPYTNYASIPNWGQWAYTTSGCAWFASSRVKELTGKGSNIYSGYSWYYNQYASLGFSRGSTIRAKALACFENHVTVVERVDGDVVTISEGGVQGSANAQYGHCHITTTSVAALQAGNSQTGAFYGYVYLGVSVDNEPLTKPTISTDKPSYQMGDTVNVSWPASSPNSPISHYWIHIVTPSNATLVSQRLDNITSYSFTVSEEGQYYIAVSATPVGSQAGEGSVTDTVYLTVEKSAGKPVLNAKGGTSVSATTFSWDKTENTNAYMLSVKKTNGTFSTVYEINKNLTSYLLVLSAGEYTAVLSAYSPSGAVTDSDEISFTVNPAVDIQGGWIYSDTLPADVTSARYEIQRKHTFEKVSSEDLGNGWTKGEFVETKLENKGEPYWSEIELSTSDTRVLLNYIYYHYCGGSNGNNANFTSTSEYPHYDSLPKDNVVELSVHNDYDDARYKYYHLAWKTGGDAYCSSGVSCDGAYGAHGNRTYYWYKSSQYQDKVKADYYSYTSTGDWTSAVEPGAAQVTYRYRAKDSSGLMLGDANLDNKVNVKDATEIQKYLASLITLGDDGKLCADADLDSKVSIKDATAIQKYLVGLMSADSKIGAYI
ncbi:MAG: hypothetical protein IJD93_06960 [Ruminococcus sp.]|nr:hypothetical protein [Ruminococcus sp.]